MIKGKINTSTLVTIAVIIAVIALAVYILFRDNPAPVVSAEDAMCIGNNSELYSQTGCSACKVQADLFGENLKYINEIDCFLPANRQLCIDKNIEATPTWIINEERYVGVQSVDTLKNLTGC